MNNRRIVCPACNTIFSELLLKQKGSENQCLVCGASLNVDESESAPEPELVDWYYYKFKDGSGAGSLRDKPIDLEKFGETYELKYQFKAPPEDENGNCEAAKEILRKEYDSTAFAPYVNIKPEPVVRCPRCRSTSVQLVPRKFSILTGYRTNKVDRVCVNCKHRW